MTQTTILASGTTAATSTDVVLAAGATANIGIFAATGTPPQSGPVAMLCMDTPGGDLDILPLSAERPATSVSGPGTFRVKRSPVTAAIGAFSET